MAKVYVFGLCPVERILRRMNKINNAEKRTKRVEPQNGYLRRLVRNLFLAWLKRQSESDKYGLEQVMEKLNDIEGSIDSIARHMARQQKRRQQ